MLDSYFSGVAAESGDGKNKDDNMMELEAVKRDVVPYIPSYQRFLKKDVRFTTQFSHIYLNRLTFLGPLVKQNLAYTFQGNTNSQYQAKVVEKIIDLATGDRGIVIGTLYKEQTMKPSVLDEFAHEFDGLDDDDNDYDNDDKENITKGQENATENATTNEKKFENFCDPSDKLILEDESGRVVLCDLDESTVNSLVTGVVVGVQGMLNSDGEFSVDKENGICYPALPLQSQRRLKQLQGKSLPSKFVLLVSGLQVGSSKGNPMRFQLLADYLTGHIGLGSLHQNLQKDIIRVVVAGNSMEKQSLPSDDASVAVDKEAQKKLVAPLKQLDINLAELASAVPVDLMAGAQDPVTITLPQQPMHNCLFPHASRCESTFKKVTNPYEFTIGETEVTFLGHSGQPIDDLQKYTKGLSPIELMENTLKWRHIAPTAPDTLPCFPFTEFDPFIIDKDQPHVYFCGNQSEFVTKLVKMDTPNGPVETRLVMLPNFSETGLAVLVDINSPTLECSTLSFDA